VLILGAAASFLTTITAFFLRLSTRSTTLAVRAGAVIALAGMGLAYVMTGPTAAQPADFRGAGAHTVGLADGWAGSPGAGVEHRRRRPPHPALHRDARPATAAAAILTFRPLPLPSPTVAHA
jgi:hypothetical protein